MNIVYFEDRFVEEEQAKIPVKDRGFQFGDGAYATLQVRDGKPRFLEEHLTQLKRQCFSFNLCMPLLTIDTIEELIARNEAFQGIWRLKIYVTGGDLLEARLPERKGRVIMMIQPFTPEPFKPLKMEIFSFPYYSCHASFKSLAHLNRYYVREEAHLLGVDDCVTVTEKNVLLEASLGNLFWVKEKKIMTPDPALPLYFGITLQNVLKCAQEMGYSVEYVKWTLDEIPKDAIAFRTNTMQGIRPIAQIGSVLFQRNRTLESLFIESYEALSQYCLKI